MCIANNHMYHCVCVCVRGHGRIRESSGIKEEEYLTQTELERGGGKEGWNQGSRDGSESFPRESS